MRYRVDAATASNYEVSSRREWLLTNGVGGFAMGTVCGANLRRYHGHLIAAIRPPTLRSVLLANIECAIQGDGLPVALSTNQYQGAVFPEGFQYLQEFWAGKSVFWRWRAEGLSLTKQMAMTQGENTITIQYQNVGDRPLQLTLRPLVCHKNYHDNFRYGEDYPGNLLFEKTKTIVEHDEVRLSLQHKGARRMPVAGWYFRFEYLRELERGLNPKDDLFCPCELTYELAPGESAVLVASDLKTAKALEMPRELDSTDFREQLVSATTPYFVETKKRSAILAGYPWFTDWGRDTMISIPGLCLSTGKIEFAKKVIDDYLSEMWHGIIPNRFADHGDRAEYNTVDATLWCFNAIFKTLKSEWDSEFAKRCFARCMESIDWHLRGTHYGIKVDRSDGLLMQGAEGIQLTWMDAKVGDWVVTPRHGKPIEIAALWINALHVLLWLAEKLKTTDIDPRIRETLLLAEASFEQKFWHPLIGQYLDTVDPDDASLRPNQLIAMALPFSPCDADHARIALPKIARELLTENGIRSLGPEEPGYHGQFRGPMSELDAAYHQGSVWPWLIGCYVDAIVKYGDGKIEAKRLLKQARTWLTECGLGGISEVYDGDKPRHPGGCPFQAWNIAEVLRAWDEISA